MLPNQAPSVVVGQCSANSIGPSSSADPSQSSRSRRSFNTSQVVDSGARPAVNLKANEGGKWTADETVENLKMSEGTKGLAALIINVIGLAIRRLRCLCHRRRRRCRCHLMHVGWMVIMQPKLSLGIQVQLYVELGRCTHGYYVVFCF